MNKHLGSQAAGSSSPGSCSLRLFWAPSTVPGTWHRLSGGWCRTCRGCLTATPFPGTCRWQVRAGWAVDMSRDLRPKPLVGMMWMGQAPYPPCVSIVLTVKWGLEMAGVCLRVFVRLQEFISTVSLELILAPMAGNASHCDYRWTSFPQSTPRSACG